MALRSSPPINTRSGGSRSLMAVPSARNSGLESTEKVVLPEGDSSSAAPRMVVITSAVRTSRVLLPPRSCGPGRRRPPGGRRLESSAGRWPGRHRCRGPWWGCSRKEHHVGSAIGAAEAAA
jgi:hypothetical protein